MATVFMEAGTDATHGLEFFDTVTGTVTSTTEQAFTGLRSIKFDSGAGSSVASAYQSSVNSVSRAICRMYFNDLPSAQSNIVMLGNATALFVRLTSAGKLQLFSNSAQIGSDSSVTIATGQWYRICVTHAGPGTTAKLFVNGTEEISATATITGSSFVVGWCTTPGANKVCYADGLYADNSTANTDLGDIRVTAKLPAANNTNSFDTAIGANPTNRWENVDDRPLSETDGWRHAAATDVQENYGLQTASAGDVNLDGATLIARCAWIRAKSDAEVVPAYVNSGAEGSAASGNITLGAPASPQTDDIWIAVVHSSDQVAHTFTDWTEIVQGNGGGTTSRISVWYFRYAGSTPNLTVTHTGGQSPIGGIAAYRGCKTTGSPVNVAGAITGGSDASIEHAAITPTVNKCCLLVCNGSADDNNRTALGGGYVVAFEDSAGGTQNCFQTIAGTPDGSVSLFHDEQVPASDTGTVTVTQAAADDWASVLIALEPSIPAGSPDIMDNGSETAVTLTSTAALYTKITDSASYPSNAAGIGIRSTGSNADTYLYECGTLIAYIPGAGQDTPELRGRPFGLRGHNHMAQSIAT